MVSTRPHKVNQETCITCGACVAQCPVEAITLEDKAQIDAEKCIDCGACVASCPVDAITPEE